MKYYLAGIKRKNMSLLANLLSDLGYEVYGYEDDEYFDEKLAEKGVIICNNILDLNEECIVVYDELEEGHRIFLKAKELNIKVYNYIDILQKLIKKFNSVCVAGLQGSNIVCNMLKTAINSNYIIGNESFGNKEYENFIYEEKNINNTYESKYIVITSMDSPNKDNYENIDDMINAFQKYANNSNKLVIACGDDPYTHTLNVNTQIFYYGINEENDITAKNVEYSTEGTIFDVYVEDEYYGHFELPIYGKYMLLNALACISICHYERIDAKDVYKKLKEYSYFNEEINDNIILNIDVKNEIELKMIIKGIRQKYPQKDIYVLNNNFNELEDINYISKNDINKYNDCVILKLEG